MKRLLTIMMMAALMLGIGVEMRATSAALLEANRFIVNIDRQIRDAREEGRSAKTINRLVYSRDSAIVKNHLNRYLRIPYSDDAAAIEESKAYLSMIESPDLKDYVDQYATMVFEHYRDDSRALLAIADDSNLKKALSSGSLLPITDAQRLRTALHDTRYYRQYYLTNKTADVVSIPYLDAIVKRIETLIDDAQVSNNAMNSSRYAGEQMAICVALDPRYSLTPENETITVAGVSFIMVAVKGGTFEMGKATPQTDDNDARPVHRVTLSNYSIGQTEVTQALWCAVMGYPVSSDKNPCKTKGDNLPVENVSYFQCEEFINRLNSMTGRQFRLPTEAEWEYAARGGGKSSNSQFSGSNYLYEVAWCESNSGSKSHHVATKTPNELGLYDMSGNVWEWCKDWYGGYGAADVTDPQGPAYGTERVRRGGSWRNGEDACSVSGRGSSEPDYRWRRLGFRLAL